MKNIINRSLCRLQAEYCSEDCRKRAYEEYHKILCFNGPEPPEPVRILDEYWRYVQSMQKIQKWSIHMSN